MLQRLALSLAHLPAKFLEAVAAIDGLTNEDQFALSTFL